MNYFYVSATIKTLFSNRMNGTGSDPELGGALAAGLF